MHVARSAVLLKWWKRTKARLLSSTAAVAVAAALSPGAVYASIINDNGGSSPNTPDYVGTIRAGDSIAFAGTTLPAYWEFTWDGAAADISSQGSFPSSYLGDDNPFRNLELYTATGNPPTSTNMIGSTPFTETSFTPSTGYLGTGFVSADLGVRSLTPGALYVVGISAQESDPSGTVTFTATAVPEPASATLLGSIVAAFGLLRHRRNLRR